MDNTIEIVLENYKGWLGNNPMIYQSPSNLKFHSEHLSILTYDKPTYKLLCTAGASKTAIPHSPGKFGSRKSCSYEYLIHSSEANLLDFHELLFEVSLYAYLNDKFISSGSVISLGKKVLSSEMEYLYLTDPYEDDGAIYSKLPHGQIVLPNKVIQTLWIIPIYTNEYRAIQEHGAEYFDNLLGQSAKNFEDLNRQPMT